jgi:hypothetical protein
MATAAGSHPIGKVFILQGTAKAVATDGTARVLGPNSIIYADERIITESDGAVSIMLDGPPPAQIDLGRMSDVLLNEDVYAGATPEVVKDASTDADKIQEALAQGDQPIELDATAAGGGAGAGGAHTLANFALDGSEVLPGAGADTTGAIYGAPGTLTGAAPVNGIVHLTATDSITEHGDQVIVYTATVDNAPTGSALILTLSNGTTITIPAGETTGSVEHTPQGNEDVYVDPSSITVSIEGATGGGYTTLDTSDGTATTAVLDTIDTTQVHITAANVTENDAGVTFNIHFDNPPQEGHSATADVQVGNDTYTVAIDAQGNGSLFIATANPDVYVDPSSITASVTAVHGGNFEATSVDGATVTAQITDTIDTTTVTLSAPDTVTENADGVTFTATLSNPGETAVTVHTDLGDITIAAGETQGTLFIATADPDVYVDPSSITATVTGVEGGNFEAVDYSQATATTVITDVDDATVVSISTSDVNENAAGVTFTLELSNPADTPATVDVQVGNTTYHVDIAAGGSTGTLFIPTADPDVYIDPSSITATVTGVVGGNYEAVSGVGDSATAQIFDTIDTTTVDLSLSKYMPDFEGPSDGLLLTSQSVTDGGLWQITATVDNAPQNTPLVLTLSDGYTITIAVGETTGLSLPIMVQGSETISITSATGGNYENLNYSDTVTGNNDVPVAYDNYGEVLEGATTPITGNVLTDGQPDYLSADNPNTVVAGTFTGSLGGTLVLLANGSYSYTAPAYVDHDAPLNDGAEVTKVEEFTYTLRDGNGDSSQATLHITIGDTAPETTAGESTLFFVQETAGNSSVIGTYTWDGVNPNTVVLHELIGNTNAHGYGSLGNIAPGETLYITSGGHTYYMDAALNAAGEFHFKDGAGNLIYSVPESGEIRIEDTRITGTGHGDGDYNDVVLRVEKGPTVSEANLSDGTHPDDAALTVHGNLYDSGKIIAGADPLTLTVDGHPLALDGTTASITVSSLTGDLTISANGDWSYTLTNNTLLHTDNNPGTGDGVTSDGDSDRGAADQVQDIFNLTVTDIDGDSITPKLIININDDGPVAVDASVTQPTAGEAFTIDLPSGDNFGADGMGAVAVIGHSNFANVTYEGGKFTYTPGEGAEHHTSDSFTYTITDGDGDKATATINVTLAVNDPPHVDVVSAATFTEGSAHAGDLAFTYSGGDPNGSVTYSLTGDNGGYLAMGDAGKIVLTQAGADAINNDVPISSLTATVTVTEVGQQGLTASDSAIDTVTAVNDPPHVDVVSAATFTEGSAHAGDLAFTYSGGDPDGSVTYSLTGDNGGYLAMGDAGKIVLTQAGADAINNDVPISSLTAEVTVTEVGQQGLTASDSAIDTVTAVNEGPYVEVTAAGTFAHSGAHAGDLAFTYSGGDPDGSVTYSLTGDNGGYLAMGDAGKIVLTQAGADAINNHVVEISSLTAEVTVTEVGQQGLHASDSAVDGLPTAYNVGGHDDLLGANTNLLIILDDSGSMGDHVTIDGHSMTKLDAAKQAIENLFTAYDTQGDVMVKLVAFNSSASEPGHADHWMTIAQAHDALSSIQAGGTTNYDAALTTAMNNFDDPGKIAGAQTVSYFLSDGEPNQPSAHPGITDYGTGTDVSITEWQTFVDGHDIVSFALGMGPGATVSALNPIAYNGITPADTNAIVVDQWSDLSGTLVNTLHALPVHGNLLTDSTPDGSFGADGGHVQSIAGLSGGTTDSSITTTAGDFDLHVTGQFGGVLDVKSDTGEYLYTPPAAPPTGDVAEKFTFTLIDGDGDTASAELSMLIDDPNHTNPV